VSHTTKETHEVHTTFYFTCDSMLSFTCTPWKLVCCRVAVLGSQAGKQPLAPEAKPALLPAGVCQHCGQGWNIDRFLCSCMYACHVGASTVRLPMQWPAMPSARHAAARMPLQSRCVGTGVTHVLLLQRVSPKCSADRGVPWFVCSHQPPPH
jgi:hypothetical protein